MKKLGIKNYNFDISNFERFRKLPKFDLIIDCCAEASVEISRYHLDRVINTNFIGTFNILKKAKKDNSKIIFISSSRVNSISSINDIFWAKDKSKWDLKKFKKMIKNKTVYLTFDVDGLDSSIMPATGTPEPGGLLWDETLNIIRIAAKNSNIVGADINELSPIKGFNSYNFLVAKLAYKILSYKFLY